MINAIDLFSGIGGFAIGLSGYTRTVLYCEQDKHAQAVLLSRMAEGKIDCAPICTDIREITSGFIDVPIDIIVGGFPCQDISVAGKGVGLEGERSGLFFEIVRLAKEIKPTFLFLENVAAIRTRGLDRVIQELTEVGYDCRWFMLSAADVGAPHKRERWFLLAHSEGVGIQGELWESREPTGCDRQAQGQGGEQADPLIGRRNVDAAPHVADTKGEQTGGIFVGGSQPDVINGGHGGTKTDWWAIEPDVGRVANGVPLRVERLKRLGNAVVPIQARTAFEYLMGIKQ